MAGDLDLTRMSAPLPPQVSKELNPTPETQDPKWVQNQFESADVSGQKRSALEQALAVNNLAPKGKLVIERDDETGKYVQKMLDPDTGEVLRQWPEEKFLELAKTMSKAYGLFFDKTI